MFQPAGVRTLLQMRSSAPTRPPTGRTRRLRTADPSAVAGRRAGAVSPTECKRKFRPLTAPAASGAVDLVSLSSLRNQARPVVEECLEEGDEEEEDECDDMKDDLQDPAVLNAEASAEIYHLQHNWLQERQDEVGRLWEQLEQQYGFKLPDSHPARQLEDFRNMDDSSAFASSMPRDAADDGQDEADEDEESKARAESILGQARSDLEVAQNFRQQLEQRRSQASADGQASCSRPGSATASTMEEGSRMGELRKELQVLRQRQYAWCEEQEESDAREAAASEHPGVSDGVPDEMSGALNQWADDLLLLGAMGAGAARSSSDLPSVESARSAEELPSSQRRSSAAQEVLAEQAAHVVAPEASPAVDDAAAMMERQLDELLGDLDEFDRIHGDLRKLTCSW